MSFCDLVASGVYELAPNTNKRCKSNVWNTFAKYRIASTKELLLFAVCKRCDIQIKHRKGEGTSTLQRHPCFKEDEAKRLEDEAETMSEVLEAKKMKILNIDPQLKLKIKEACVKFCAFDLRPYAAVEGDGFKTIAKCMIEVGATSEMDNLDVDSVIPHRTTAPSVDMCKKRTNGN